MLLEGAPVSGLTLLISTLSATLVRGHYTHNRNMTFAAGTALKPLTTVSLIKRLLLESIPGGPLGISFIDICLGIDLLYQFRTLERRWGSNSFLSFLLTSSMLGVGMVQLLVTESGSKQLSVEAVRILSAAGSLVPLAALVSRYLHEVPTRATFNLRVPGTNFHISEKAFVALPLLKLLLSPSTQLEAQTFRRPAVFVDVGLWTRLCCTVLGVIFAMLSTRSAVMRWWLSLFSRFACHPLLRFLRPLTDMLFGPSFTVDHAKPRTARQQPQHGNNFPMGADNDFGGGGAGGVMDGGRYVVESLTGGDALQEVRARMRARRHGAQQQQAPAGVGRGVQGGVGATQRRLSPQEEAAQNSAIAAVEAIGLSASRDDIRAALDMAGGNLELAVQILLGN